MTSARTFEVPDIHCGHCASSIEGAVGAITGITSVTVRVDDRAVDVSYESDAVDVDTIVAAIEDQGYVVTG